MPFFRFARFSLTDSRKLPPHTACTLPPAVWRHAAQHKATTLLPHVQSHLCAASQSLGVVLSLSLATASEREQWKKWLFGLSRCQGLPSHATLLSALVNYFLVTDLLWWFLLVFCFPDMFTHPLAVSIKLTLSQQKQPQQLTSSLQTLCMLLLLTVLSPSLLFVEADDDSVTYHFQHNYFNISSYKFYCLDLLFTAISHQYRLCSLWAHCMFGTQDNL
jgi:hypothetical protein